MSRPCQSHQVLKAQSFYEEANTWNSMTFWLQARQAFWKPLCLFWTQAQGRSCFCKPWCPSLTLGLSVHIPGQQPIPMDWITDRIQQTYWTRKDSFLLFPWFLALCTFRIPAWKDMNPSREASVFLPWGHLGFVWMAHPHWVCKSGNYRLQVNQVLLRKTVNIVLTREYYLHLLEGCLEKQ